MKTSSLLLLPLASALPHLTIEPATTLVAREFDLERRASCYPLNFAVQATVPFVDAPAGSPSFTIGGYRITLPRAALEGALVSFYGNFQNSSLNTGITTSSNSTSQRGPPSTTNGNAFANQTNIITNTFTSGNSSVAVAGAQGSGTSTSTSSSGAANSTAVATADQSGNVQIFTSANTAAAANQQSLANERAAAAATSCAAQNTGASSSASQVTAIQYESSSGVQVSSVAYAACAAGIVIPANQQDSGSSSSGSQASIRGVSASVTCDGTMIRNTKSSTTFIVQVKGSYCQDVGFRGAVAGQRAANTEAQC